MICLLLHSSSVCHCCASIIPVQIVFLQIHTRYIRGGIMEVLVKKKAWGMRL